MPVICLLLMLLFLLLLSYCYWFCSSFSCCSDSDYCSVVLSAGRTFGSRLHGGIRSSGPTPTGSCWRTCQSPPNPLARFRAVATVRCVKTPSLATVPVAPPLSRRGLRSWHPGKRPPGCTGQRRFANRASRRCGGSLPVVLSGAIHLFKPLSPGANTAQPSPPVQGEMQSSQNFLPRSRQKTFAVCPRIEVSVRGSDAPCGEGSQKGDGEYRREQKAVPAKRQNANGSRNSKDDGG